jgi:hypothetical protein
LVRIRFSRRFRSSHARYIVAGCARFGLIHVNDYHAAAAAGLAQKGHATMYQEEIPFSDSL